MNPILSLDHLGKTFRDFWLRPRVRAVHDLSLSIQPGEILGLLGPNGSGKSTTIKMLLGLLQPTTGSIRVFNLHPHHPSVRARIGYLPEESRLYQHLTPHETLLYFGSLFDLPAPTRAARTEQLLHMVGLHEAANRPIREFSKGMARRVGLAQALINDPDFIVLDEPTSGLDPIGRHQVKILIRQLATRGKTVLLSSHLLSEVADVCDRVAVLFRGELQATGHVNDLLARKELLRLTLPTPPDPNALPNLLAAIHSATGTTPTVDHPTMSLEEFFLDIITRADGSLANEPQLAPFLSDSATTSTPSK